MFLESINLPNKPIVLAVQGIGQLFSDNVKDLTPNMFLVNVPEKQRFEVRNATSPNEGHVLMDIPYAAITNIQGVLDPKEKTLSAVVFNNILILRFV